MIPKQIFLCWPNHNIWNLDHKLVRMGLFNLRDLNPEYDIQIFNDEQVRHDLKQSLEKTDYNLIENSPIIQQIDLWRLVKLYLNGGIYCDMDRIHDMPLNISDTIKCVLPICGESGFSHDFMATDAGNPIFFKAIELYVSRRHQGITHTYLLGPQTYMHAVSACMVGQQIDVNPDKQDLEYLKRLIEHSSFLETVQENPPLHTITHRNSWGLTVEAHEYLKRELYKLSNLHHWTGEW
jgi:mannosyltransferase OCH1-like enzyme